MNLRNFFFSPALRIWLGASSLIGVGALVYFLLNEPNIWWAAFPILLMSIFAGIPAWIILIIILKWISRLAIPISAKWNWLTVMELILGFGYGLPLGGVYSLVDGRLNIQTFILPVLIISAMVAASLIFSSLLSHIAISNFLNLSPIIVSNQKLNNMESTIPTPPSFGGTFLKGVITAALILLMLIPMIFINNLIDERELRQKEVAQEVSSKWASSQTLAGPFLYVPFKYAATNSEGKPVVVSSYFWILPDNMDITGTIDHQVRRRSIYKVLLYRTAINAKGNFIVDIPADVSPQLIQWKDVKVCYRISDFKGIEEKMVVNFNNLDYELSPGLPADGFGTKGLSATVQLDSSSLQNKINFSTSLKIKGSESLHFIPLSGNSSFQLSSTWTNPSFDGNSLPSDREVTPSGFAAKWIFNKANLPFNTVLRNTSFNAEEIAFGVTLIEPADQYAKTQRSVKYALLIIGLTFSLFFIIELLQKKPVHPVQYVLIGLALVIFYTLLLSFSEFIVFDLAYGIAAFATVALITLYTKSHFNSWKPALVFSAVLSMLYGFIFVLVRLEDTALIVGSIGLFVILAIAMYASRKVNWYGM